jgi:hypothetical protein
MATYSRILLSASNAGQPIAITSNSAPGTVVHNGVAGNAAFDEIYGWISNLTNGSVTVSVELGGVVFVSGLSIPANSPPIPLLTGQVVNGNSNVTVFASNATNAVVLAGYVNRIS